MQFYVTCIIKSYFRSELLILFFQNARGCARRVFKVINQQFLVYYIIYIIDYIHGFKIKSTDKIFRSWNYVYSAESMISPSYFTFRSRIECFLLAIIILLWNNNKYLIINYCKKVTLYIMADNILCIRLYFELVYSKICIRPIS